MTSQPSTTSRQMFLEQKIRMLDQRLTAVEKFIDLRFRSAKENTGNSEDEEAQNVKKSRLYSTTKKLSLKKNIPRSENDDCQKPGSHRRKRVQAIHIGLHKKLKACPASVKRRKEEEAVAKARGLKECAVRVVRAAVPEKRNSGATVGGVLGTSSSGRTRRVPKRFQAEIDVTPKGSRRRKGRSEEDDNGISSIVKVERDDSPEVELYEEDDDNNNGLASPVDHEEENDGEGYFTFPSPSMTSERVAATVTQEKRSKKRTRKPVDVKAMEDENDDIDVDWELGDGFGEDDDDDIDEDEDAMDDDDDIEDRNRKRSIPSQLKRGSRPTSSTSSRMSSSRLGKKRGKYNIIKREDAVNSRKRKHIKLELTEIPTGAIANADPGLKLCHLCNWHFKAEVFEAHLEAHARERHLKCPICDKSYYNQFILKKHMRVHEPEKYSKKCRHCGKPFVHSDKLLYHERYCVKKALEKNEHVAPELIEDLRKRSKLDTKWIEQAIETGSRLAAITPGEKKLCPHCKRNFKAENFDRHVLTHTRAKNWSCNMCDKAYHYKHDLVRHVASDHVTVPTCEICEKTFSDRAELKLHATPCRREHRNKIRQERGLKVKNIDSLLTDDEENTLEEEDSEHTITKERDAESGVKREESYPAENKEVITFEREGQTQVGNLQGGEDEENLILEVSSHSEAALVHDEEEIEHVLVFDDDAVEEETQVVTLGLVRHSVDDEDGPQCAVGE